MFAKQFGRLMSISLLALSAGHSMADQLRPDSHGPIGVMGEHTHHQGELMFSYRYMLMDMDDNRDGTERLSTDEVLLSGTGQYRVAPLEMTMEMHMLGIMYAPSDKVTLMAMVPWIENSMDHLTAMGGSFETESSHLGDVSLSALMPLNDAMYWSIGMSFPTGSQDEKDDTPMGKSVLPYPMQIGSGTYDVMASLGSNHYFDLFSSGWQVSGTIRTGENSDDYTLGNRYGATGWFARNLSSSLSISGRLNYAHVDEIDGADPRYTNALAINLVPTVDPDLRGGQRIDFSVGFNFAHKSGHRLALEYQVPVWQDLNGPQLETDSVITFGWQYTRR